MKVLLWPAGGPNDATAQYRIRLPAAPLIAAGHDIYEDMNGPVLIWDRPWDARFRPPPDMQLVGLGRIPEADVIVMQRPAEKWWAELVPMLQEVGIRVVVDVDDLFDGIDDGNYAKQFYDPAKRTNSARNHLWTDLACQRADLVTCTTPALRRRYGHGHGVVLPNYVPASYLSISGERPGTIGWSGSVLTHPKDLQVTGGAVADALNVSDWTFHHIGSGAGVRGCLGLPDEPSHTEWVPFADYPYELAKMEVGIVPLADTPFNEAKSALKMSEMASVGVPVVGSPSPDNVRVQALGVGRLATTPQKWRKVLTSLLKNPAYRVDLAGTQREAMAGLTYEGHAEKWMAAWASVYDEGARRRSAIEHLDYLLNTEVSVARQPSTTG